jgi:predicted nucleic acid-binding protein
VIVNDGLVDTNVFVHAHATDAHSAECVRFLTAVEAGQVRAQMDPLVLPELSYVLPRFFKQMTRRDVADYLLVVLGWTGIVGEKALLADSVELWRDTPGLAFVDAYLVTRAKGENRPIYSKNVEDIRPLGAAVPDPLPG